MFITTTRKQKKEVLYVAYFVAVVQPLMVLPQILQIFDNKSAQDVSLTTWLMLLVFNTSNFIYGLVYNIRPMVINNLLWVLVEIVLVTGIVLYR